MADLRINKALLRPNLWEQNKSAVQSKVEARILANVKAGRDPRDGLSTLKIGDSTFEIKDVNQWIKNRKAGSKARVSIVDSVYRQKKNLREKQLETMTGEGGTKTKYGAGARKLLKGQQDHHLRFRVLFEPFYENLDENQAKELTKWFEQQGSPLGNVLENLEGVDQDLHQTLDDSLHTWAKENQIQVDTFTKDEWKTGARNIKGGIARGGADSELYMDPKKYSGKQMQASGARKIPQAKMPYLGDLPLNKRLVAASDYLNYVEEPLLKKSSEVMEKQDLRRLKENPNYKAKTKEQWFNKWKTEGKAAAQSSMAIEDLAEKHPNLKETDINEILENIKNPKKKLSSELTERLQIQGNNPARTVLKRIGGANIIGRTLTHAGKAAASPLIGPDQGEAITKFVKTGDKKYLGDLAIATGTDVAVGSAFGVGAKAIAQRQLTKGLIKKGLTRAVLGTVSGPVGWGLLAYSLVDTANAVSRASTGKGLVGHAKDLFIKNQDNPAKGVQIARVVPEKRGGFTRTQWENLKNKLNDPNDPTGNYRSPGGPVFDVNTIQIKGV